MHFMWRIGPHVFTIIHVDTLHGSKGDFPASCAVTSRKNETIVANLTVVVLSAEDCCASSMKLWVPKKVVLFVVYLSITLALFILNTVFIENFFFNLLIKVSLNFTASSIINCPKLFKVFTELFAKWYWSRGFTSTEGNLIFSFSHIYLSNGSLKWLWLWQWKRKCSSVSTSKILHILQVRCSRRTLSHFIN